jgi:two-component system response regulator NreC
VKILLADDNEIMRKLIRSVLNTRTDIRVCGDASNGKEAVEKTGELKPDLVILDLSMPPGGRQIAKQIGDVLPEARILWLSAYDGAGLTKHAQLVGVRGFVRKDQANTSLLKAIDALLSGQTFFPA